MPKPYSMDLRERAIARLRSGESTRSVAASLSIGVATAVRWGQRYRSTGSMAPLPMGGSEPSGIVGEDAIWLRERIGSGGMIAARAGPREFTPRSMRGVNFLAPPL